MQDLAYTYRYSYALHPHQARAAAVPGAVPLIVNEAHRALRNGVAIALVLGIPTLDVEQAIGRIEAAIDAADAELPWHAPALSAGDAAIVSAFATLVTAACARAFDRDGAPSGPLGQRIERDIASNADSTTDSVFARSARDAIELRAPRMAFGSVLGALEGIGVMLRFALAQHVDILLCPAVWGATEIDPECLA